MRSIEEIKAEIGAEYIRHPKVIERYGLEAGKSFDEQFSKLSIENLLFYAVATVIYSIEWIRETFLADVETAKKESMCGNAMWYRQQCLQFEYAGEDEVSLVWDAENASWKYNFAEGSYPGKNRIVSECAVAYINGWVQIKTSKTKDGKRCPLEKEELNALTTFIDKIKIVGTAVQISSKQPDKLHCEMTVYYNAFTHKFEDLSEKVSAASNNYLEQLPFGGCYDVNKHIQAIMSVEGVESVKAKEVYITEQENTKEEFRLVSNGKINNSFMTLNAGYIDTDPKTGSTITFNYETA